MNIPGTPRHDCRPGTTRRAGPSVAVAMLAVFAATSPTPVFAQAPDADALSAQATDPTASLMQMNFIGDVRTSFYGFDDGGFEFRFQPVIPFNAFGYDNLLRVVVPYQMSGLGADGLKSVSIFDLIVMEQTWGRLGIGPVMNLSEGVSGNDTQFAIGPAIGAVMPMDDRLSVGAFNQNLFGDNFAISQFQPVVAYQLGSGWALSAGDLQFIYDWHAKTWVSVPLGFQLGVVQPVAGQPIRFSINPQWNLRELIGQPRSKIIFTVTLLAPTGG